MAMLLVEDEAANRELFKLMLEKMGHRVIAVPNGKKAIKAFKENQFAIRLILLDFMLPGINGDKVHDTIREIAPNIPIIFISGYSPPGKISKRIDKNTGFLQKPVKFETLQKNRAIPTRVKP
jgi:CheY-like chemotaxis protein